MRLQKYIAEAGVASRRKAEEYIAAGRVAVNGTIAVVGQIVSDGDEVVLDGKEILLAKKFVYIMLNKPAGVISSVSDQFGRQTVLDLVKGVNVRMYPVGRLDYHSTGLVLLTNDGELANRLMHPRHGHSKTYVARVKMPIRPAHIHAFKNGINIDDYETKPAEIELMDKQGKQAKITLREGRNRQIRKMFAVLDNEVVSLKRVAVGNIALGELDTGTWRYLTSEEMQELKNESAK